MSDSFFEEAGSRLLTSNAFDFVLDGEMKRAVRSQNYLTLVVFETQREWDGFVRKYRAEMARPDNARLIALLAALSHRTDFAVGCYCEDESRCHRSVLRQLLTDAGARLTFAG